MAELCENIRNFEDMATYYRYTRSAQNIQRYNFTLATTVLNTEVGDDCATVELYAHITFQYEEGGETAECGDRYQVTFGKVGGTWCIVDIVSEEMIAYGMTPDSFNLDAAIAEFDRLQEQGPVVQMVEPENQTDGAAEPAALNDAVNTYRYYNRDNATAYAYTYTTDSYTGSSGNNTNFTNDNFSYYSDGNCQNFASQCIWAGLGGSDTSDDIDSLKFLRFLRSVAARTSQQVNYKGIADDAEIDQTTAKNWLHVLEALGIIFLLEPYSNNVLKRTVSTPKLYFYDSGIVCYLTRWSSPETAMEGAMSGALLENYTVAEIIKTYQNAGQEPFLYYYRDKDAREIDLILERDGKLFPIEIKKMASPPKKLTKVFDLIDKSPLQRGTGAILCMADQLGAFDQNNLIVPISLI